MICPFCKEDKPKTDFGVGPTTPKFDWWCKRCEANRQSVRKHGVTNEQKAQIAEAQGGCAICGHEDPGSRGWNLDHDRSCCEGSNSCPKCRRGVLCGWCNKMLAYAFDRPQILQAAIEYLEQHALGTCDWHMPVACAPKVCGASSTDATDTTNAESFSPNGANVALVNARRGAEK